MATVGTLPMPGPNSSLTDSDMLDPSVSPISYEAVAELSKGVNEPASTKTFFATAMAHALKVSLQHIDRSSGGMGKTITSFHGYQPRLEDYLQHQRRVYELGMSNTVYTSCVVSLSDNTSKAVHDMVQEAVQNLLTEENLKNSGVRSMNSNEPVLLISLPQTEQMTKQVMREFRDNITKVLKYDYGCAPVRVFVRLNSATEEGSTENLELALLNVVNSETGGPSMIQLLDAAFYGEGWKTPDPAHGSMMVSKEAWSTGGWDLLWRDEAHLGDRIDVVSPRVSEEHTGPTVETSVEAPIAIDSAGYNCVENEDSSEKAAETVAEETSSLEPPNPERTGANPPSEDDNEEEPAAIEHPAMVELRSAEALRPKIQHPSWNRGDESESLLDLIRQQSSTVKNSAETESAGIEHLDSSIENIDHKGVKSTKSTSEDSFELV